MFKNIFGKKKEKGDDPVRKLMQEIIEINNNTKETVKQLEILNEKLKEINKK